jgi:5-methylthioadenosine/S-adenosylhomocysteine deaminase
MDRIETQPMYDPISQLVYATGRQHVTDVWIDGHAQLRDGELTGIDAAALIANARQWRGRIAVVGTQSQ